MVCRLFLRLFALLFLESLRQRRERGGQGGGERERERDGGSARGREIISANIDNSSSPAKAVEKSVLIIPQNNLCFIHYSFAKSSLDVRVRNLGQCLNSDSEFVRQTDRQADKQTDGWTETETDRGR